MGTRHRPGVLMKNLLWMKQARCPNPFVLTRAMEWVLHLEKQGEQVMDLELNITKVMLDRALDLYGTQPVMHQLVVINQRN